MTYQDIQILLQYLNKVVVPANDHDAFIQAYERLQNLLKQQKKVA